MHAHSHGLDWRSAGEGIFDQHTTALEVARVARRKRQSMRRCRRGNEHVCLRADLATPTQLATQDPRVLSNGPRDVEHPTEALDEPTEEDLEA